MVRIVVVAVTALAALGAGAWLTGANRHRPPAPLPAEVRLDVDLARPVAEVDERFLSFAVDTAQVVGGAFWAPPGTGQGLLETRAVPAYDFARPRLRALAGALAPAYLRIGGTDADRTVYRMGEDGGGAPPAGARWVLTRERWDQVNEFASTLGLRIMFTLNAGPSARDADGAWDPESARGLVAYSQRRGYPIDVWELGNEINLFPLAHLTWLGPERYGDDVELARRLLDDLHAPGRLAGVGSAFWPVLGEGRSFSEVALGRAGRFLDVVTWHYYPQQSQRCPLATRRAAAGRPLDADELAEVERWAARMEEAARAHAPSAAVWLGETGSAQCGGEPGLSDTYADTLWWLDELGRLARRGQRVVVRQTLSGSDYGLVDDRTLRPNPSYWASWLWRDLMGTRVLAASTSPGAESLRAYAHCLRGGGDGSGDRPAGGVAVLLINVHPTDGVTVDLGGAGGSPASVLRVDADGPAARALRLDGAVLDVRADGSLPPPPRLDGAGGGAPAGASTRVSMAPLSIAFVALPQAHAPACR
jgi:hypothetical protein